MRILGIDYGDARIGLALSDPTATVAGSLGVHKATTMRKDIDYVADIALSREVVRIVIGLPLNMDGSEGERASKTRAFGRNLEKVSDIEVVYQDERLTTVSAAYALKASGVKKHRQNAHIDTASAQIILQAHLEKNKFSI